MHSTSDTGQPPTEIWWSDDAASCIPYSYIYSTAYPIIHASTRRARGTASVAARTTVRLHTVREFKIGFSFFLIFAYAACCSNGFRFPSLEKGEKRMECTPSPRVPYFYISSPNNEGGEEYQEGEEKKNEAQRQERFSLYVSVHAHAVGLAEEQGFGFKNTAANDHFCVCFTTHISSASLRFFWPSDK